jgi:hypothetical protein
MVAPQPQPGVGAFHGNLPHVANINNQPTSSNNIHTQLVLPMWSWSDIDVKVKVMEVTNQRYAMELQDIVTSPSQQDPCTKLNTELLNRLSSSERRALQLLTFEEIGEHKSSQFLRHPWNLASDLPDYLLLFIWISRLPSNVQTTLAGMPEVDLDASAFCADRIVEAVSPPSLLRIASPTDSTQFQGRLTNSPAKWRLSTGQNSLRPRDHRPRSRNPSNSARDRRSSSRNRPGNGSHPRDGTATTVSWYHRSLSGLCLKVFPALHLQPWRKLTQQTSATAHVCTTTTSRLFITDKVIPDWHWFLPLCVPP